MPREHIIHRLVVISVVLKRFYCIFVVSGVCLGRTSGSYKISYHIGRCTGHGNYGEGYTGWGSSFHIIVEEIAFELTKTCANGSPVNCDN